MAHHGQERNWLCNECPKNYKTKIDLLQHQRVHDKARDPFRCPSCPMLFRTRSNYNTHLRTHNTKGPQQCSLCDGKVFVNLRSHIQMVHQKVRQHKCTICEKAFGKKSGLDRHIITVHERLKCWACDLCEKSFGEKAQLMRHRKVHFKPAHQEIDVSQITDDQEVFEKEKKCMRCGICKKTVNSKAALKRHKLLVHEKKKTLLCDFCPRFFGEKSNLMRHIIKSHTKESNDSIVKEEVEEDQSLETSFECGSCGRTLTTKWGWQAHENVCRIKQQEKLNRQFEDNDEENVLSDIGLMEQVFLVSGNDDDDESLVIKQEEPPFVDDNLSNASVSKFIPQVSQIVLSETNEILIKQEPAEYLDDDDIVNTEEETFELEESLEPETIVKEENKLDNESSNQEWEDAYSEPEKGDDQVNEPAVTFLKRYKCKLCPNTFKEKRYFQSHFLTVHGKKKVLKCTVSGCDENFVYRAQRLRHLRQKHPEIYEESDEGEKETELNDSFECELCDLVFECQNTLDNHIKQEHDANDDEKTCELCNPYKVFKKTRYLMLHLQAVHSDQTFSCEQCSKTFSFKRSLDRHIKGVHEDVRDFNCEESDCEKSFRNKYELKQHMIGSHNKGDKSDRTCKVCFKVFKKVKYMEIHCTSVHNSEPQFSCPICQRSFSFQRSMERHVKAIHEDRRDYKCDADGCEKAFRSRYDLSEHFNNIHALIKKKKPAENVTCDICEKVCSTRKVLYSHKKLVHEGVKWGLKFECKLCKENFESKYKKSKHWGQVHRNGEIKVRTCHLCNSEFQLFEDFKAHIESHVGYFICITCGYSFNDESSLYLHHETHRKIEEELRQYVCDVCSHRLSTKAQLLIHMRKHFSGDHYMCDVRYKNEVI